MNLHVVPEPVIDVSGRFPECLVSAYSLQFLNMTLQNRLPPPVDIKKLTFKNSMSLTFNVSDKMYVPVHVPPSAQCICYENTVTLGDEIYLGKVPKQNCKRIFMPCTKNQTGHFRQSEANRGVVCTNYFNAPNVMGTTPQMNFVWLCGLDIYYHLSTGWKGRCAPPYQQITLSSSPRRTLNIAPNEISTRNRTPCGEWMYPTTTSYGPTVRKLDLRFFLG